MPKNSDFLVRRSDVLTAEGVEGEIRCNIGDSVTGEGEGSQIAMWASGDGFISCPNEPDGDGACEVLTIADGTGKKIIASRDNRYAAKTGNPLPGDRFIVSNCNARAMLKAATDAFVIFSANALDNDSSMMVSVDGSAGTILTVNGGSYVQQTKDKIVLSAGGSMLVIDANGVATFGPHTALNTASGNLGVMAGIVPIAPAQSVLSGPTGLAAVPSSRWTVAV